MSVKIIEAEEKLNKAYLKYIRGAIDKRVCEKELKEAREEIKKLRSNQK